MFTINTAQWGRTIVVASLLFSIGLLSACERTPPDFREEVSLPLYTAGDADNGALIYEDACGQCHQLTPGSNKKGPQLVNIYGAKAAALSDYKYSEALAASDWVWDAETLDPYIADAEKAMPDSKMLADPMPDARERADIIAYLSTIRAAIPPLDEKGFPIKNAPNTGASVKSDSDIDNNNDSNTSNSTHGNTANVAAEKQNMAGKEQMSNDAIEVSSDPAQKPAADFR